MAKPEFEKRAMETRVLAEHTRRQRDVELVYMGTTPGGQPFHCNVKRGDNGLMCHFMGELVRPFFAVPMMDLNGLDIETH